MVTLGDESSEQQRTTMMMKQTEEKKEDDMQTAAVKLNQMCTFTCVGQFYSIFTTGTILCEMWTTSKVNLNFNIRHH